MVELPTNGSNGPVFQTIDGNEDAPEEVTELESMCMNCHENGMTRLLLIKIPFYREVILMSFHCDHCGYSNNELQSGSKVDEHGLRLTLKVISLKDMNRQVVKSKYTSVHIPEVDLEIPAGTGVGEITTVEGIINDVISKLSLTQSDRLTNDPQQAVKIATFISDLNRLLIDHNFTLVLDDCSGSCFIENTSLPYQMDKNIESVKYGRTFEQEKLLGFVADDAVQPAPQLPSVSEEEVTYEVQTFQILCPSCGGAAQENMKLTNIPSFKELIIMSTVCEACGYRNAEVKVGGGINDQGVKIILKVQENEDLGRDCLKSDTCTISIPELELEAHLSILDNRLTTVEGLINGVKDQMNDQSQFYLGDSANDGLKGKLETFLGKLDRILKLELPATIVLDDACGKSYIQNIVSKTEDTRLDVQFYERTFEQNEELGLNDMQTEHYENSQ